MTYLYEAIKPTVLMVKKHNKTGLLYFHKTNRLDRIDQYLGSGPYWVNHLSKHGKDVTTLWTSQVFTDESIIEFALKFSNDHDIVNSNLWANKCLETGIGGGDLGPEVNTKRIETLNSTEFKSGKWAKAVSKISETRNSAEWKATVGKEAVRKDKEKKRDPEWINTVGKVFRESNRIRQIETKSSAQWKSDNSKICEHCGKTCDIGNHNRWHGDNCKMRQNSC